MSEYVLGKAPQKCSRHPKTSKGTRGVERSTAWHSASGTVPSVDHVHQGFTADDDHGAISPEPRVIIRVGTMWCSDGDRYPSSRLNRQCAAARPETVGRGAAA